MGQEPVNILLIEDNPDHVELIIKALRDSNVLNEVHVVTSGEQAFDFLYQREAYVDAARPALILLDIKLPGMDGIEFLRWIKADPKLKVIPVVVLSTSENPKDIVGCYGYGANSYIVKPVDFRQFAKVVKEVNLYWMVINSLPK